MEGTCLEALARMAMPLCQSAQRQCPRTGPGRTPAFADWQIAVLIMTAVMAKRKSKSAQYRYLYERRVWLQSLLKMEAFPARSTYFARYHDASRIFRQAVVLQGRQAIAEGIIQAGCVAVDKSLLVARGPAWHQYDRRRGRRRPGVDEQANWGYSDHHGWVYGYSYEVVCSRGRASPRSGNGCIAAGESDCVNNASGVGPSFKAERGANFTHGEDRRWSPSMSGSSPSLT
jgi:hypothetical protein